jgi:hypothetical protein
MFRCKNQAEAGVFIDYDKKTVVIKELGDEDREWQPNILEYCIKHVKHYTVPNGWNLSVEIDFDKLFDTAAVREQVQKSLEQSDFQNSVVNTQDQSQIFEHPQEEKVQTLSNSFDTSNLDANNSQEMPPNVSVDFGGIDGIIPDNSETVIMKAVQQYANKVATESIPTQDLPVENRGASKNNLTAIRTGETGLMPLI